MSMLFLKPSKIHGVGVFSSRAIRKGEAVPLFAAKDWRFYSDLLTLERWTRFCSWDRRKGGWYCPRDPHRMSVGWYINDAPKHNVEPFTWLATRYIKRGEELTTNYRAFNKPGKLINPSSSTH